MKNKKIIAPFIIFLFSLGGYFFLNLPEPEWAGASPSGWCYQETANASTASDGDCGLNYSGFYKNLTSDPSNEYDGNWDTSCTWEDPQRFNVTYFKPYAAFNLTKIKLKTYCHGLKNATIPQACWDFNESKIVLKCGVFSTYVAGCECWDGSSWVWVYKSDGSSGACGNRFYEEGVWWYINTKPQISLSSPQSYYWDENATVNATATDVENSTLMIEFIWRVDNQIVSLGNLTTTNGTSTVIPDLDHSNFSAAQTINLTVRAWDGWNWSNYSSVQKQVLGVRISHPEDSSEVWDRTPKIIYTSDNATCSLIINNSTVYNLGVDATSYSSDSFYSVPLSTGRYNLSINCSGQFGKFVPSNLSIWVNYFRLNNSDICVNISFPHLGGNDSSVSIVLPCDSYNVSLDLNISGQTNIVSVPDFSSEAVCEIYQDDGGNSIPADCSTPEVGWQEGPGDCDDEHRVLIEFNFSDYFNLENWTINSASVCGKFTYTYQSWGATSITLRLYNVTQRFNHSMNWTSNDTINNWTTPGAPYSTLFDSQSIPRDASNLEKCFNITSYFQSFIDNPDDFIAFILVPHCCDSSACEITLSISDVKLKVNYSTYPHNVSLNDFFNWSYSGIYNESQIYHISDLIETNLSGSSSNCSYPLSFSANSAGKLSVCLVNRTFQLRHFDPNIGLSRGIPNLYFFPKHLSEKNVSAWKQNSTIGVLNITGNDSHKFDLMIKLGSPISLIDLKCSNDSYIGNATNLTTSYFPIITKVMENSTHMIWCWADYYNPPSLPGSYEVWFDAWSWD